MRIWVLGAVLLAGCSMDVNGLKDTELVGYISIAETWREICADRYNQYDYPNLEERELRQSECRRRFAEGEEVIDLPDIPYEEFQ